ncbi:MAG: mycofactocin precursor [Candidatus Lambdaproteobacteria bacterium]|nr:mycofactocin precursor [Candidatus Lambdaproteobacteria bacterium]
MIPTEPAPPPRAEPAVPPPPAAAAPLPSGRPPLDLSRLPAPRALEVFSLEETSIDGICGVY